MLISAATPYCGFKRRMDKRAAGQIYVPRSAEHVLVSAPMGAGKTRRVLAPAAVLWGGPTLVVSPKDDILQHVMERRWGPMALIDMRPIPAPVYPEGLLRPGYDPTAAIAGPHEALAVAETMMQAGAVPPGWGATAARGREVFESRAVEPLATLLYAASPAGNGQGMDWVLRAVDNTDSGCTDEPGWYQGLSICDHTGFLGLGLHRMLRAEAPRLRQTVAAAMRAALTPWLRVALAGRGGERFDPRFLDDPQATVFVLAPGDGTVAACVVTLLDSLIRRWRDKAAARAPMERLLIVVDDLPNTAPLPNLRFILGEGGGLGINLLAAVQASSQLDTVYGGAYANELRDIFPATVIMYGARESELMAGAESWSGLTTRHPATYSQADGHSYLHSELGAGLRWQELLPRNRDEARLLVRGTLGSSVEIPDWTVFRQLYDTAVRYLLSRSDGHTGGGEARMVERLQRWWRNDEMAPGAAQAWATGT